MLDDRHLLDRYLSEGSEEAFRELVRRNLGLVYSAALRQVRDSHWAQDVTQQVFANLARKARTIRQGMTLAGWLHRDTRFTALNFLRAEARRARREQQAIAMNALDSEPPHDWEQIRPLIDEALDQLGAADRDALLLRYFQEREFAEVGAALGASAEAARKRVDRALDRLREYLVKRGITTTAGALGAALSAHGIEIVPTGLAASLAATSSAVLAKAAAPVTSSWISNLLLMTKTKSVVVSVLAAAALSTPLVVQQRAIATARAERAELLARQHPAAPQAETAPQLAAELLNANAAAQRDRSDLERLRRETATLRHRISQLNAQANRLVAARSAALATSSATPSGTPIGQTIRVTDARDVGQATPAALMQTFVWALAHGDTNRLGQLLAFPPMIGPKALEHIWKKFQDAAAEAAASASGTISDAPIEIRLIEEQPAEGNDRWMVIQEVYDHGRSVPTSRGRVTWTDTGWRMLIGTNGEPVGGPIKPPQ